VDAKTTTKPARIADKTTKPSTEATRATDKPTTKVDTKTTTKPEAAKATAKTDSKITDKPATKVDAKTSETTAKSDKPAAESTKAADKPTAKSDKPTAKADTDKTAGKTAAVGKTDMAAKTAKSSGWEKGYKWGKTNTEAGLKAGGQTLKAAFHPKTMLIGAGMTVGMKIYQQVKNGEKVDIGKAVGYLATGEFVGGYVGAGLGAAAGSAIGAFVGGGIPVVGPIIGAFMPSLFAIAGGSIGSQMGNGLSTGRRPTLKEAWANIDKADMAGRAAGSTIGMMIGSALLPGIGTFVGGFVGNLVGGKLVSMLRGKKGDELGQVRVVGPGMAIVTTVPNDMKASSNSNFGNHDTSNGSGTVTHDSTSSGDSINTVKARMEAAYKRYSQLLANDQGNSQEAIQALKEYKEAYNEYSQMLMQR
jgi:hypothetical protein